MRNIIKDIEFDIFRGEYRYTTMISGKIVLPELPYKSIYKHCEKSSVA